MTQFQSTVEATSLATRRASGLFSSSKDSSNSDRAACKCTTCKVQCKSLCYHKTILNFVLSKKYKNGIFTESLKVCVYHRKKIELHMVCKFSECLNYLRKGTREELVSPEYNIDVIHNLIVQHHHSVGLIALLLH